MTTRVNGSSAPAPEVPKPRPSRKLPRFSVIWRGAEIWRCEAGSAQAALELAEKVTGWSREELEIREAKR